MLWSKLAALQISQKRYATPTYNRLMGEIRAEVERLKRTHNLIFTPVLTPVKGGRPGSMSQRTVEFLGK